MQQQRATCQGVSDAGRTPNQAAARSVIKSRVSCMPVQVRSALPAEGDSTRRIWLSLPAVAKWQVCCFGYQCLFSCPVWRAIEQGYAVAFYLFAFT